MKTGNDPGYAITGFAGICYDMLFFRSFSIGHANNFIELLFV